MITEGGPDERKAESTIDSAPRLRVLSFESRRGEEMRALIVRHGGEATIAPSMREIPLTENGPAFHFGAELLAGRIDILVFLTGVGATSLMEALELKWPRSEIVSAMNRCVTVIRGPKPAVVLRDWGLRIDHRAPEPNTWREVISTMDAAVTVSGKLVAVQEYGKPSVELIQALQYRGANVLSVPVYRWDLPEDTAPLRSAIHETVSGRFDAVLFTSAQQFHHARQIAEEEGCGKEWLAALNRCVVASIGPTNTETLLEAGVKVDLEPTHSKMGTLVKETLERGGELLRVKTSKP